MQHRPFYQDLIQKIAFRHGKMAFLSGPRQVGKTTLAIQMIEEAGAGKGYYHNWDDLPFKRQWMKDPKVFIPEKVGEKSLVVFDELQKAPRWKSTLKGVYDLRGRSANILVTGSSKLDVFRRGGDSLLGRYFPVRMHPFSLGEITGISTLPDRLGHQLGQSLPSFPEDFERLSQFGGFPDPYFKQDKNFWNLWKNNRLERMIREDLLSLTHAQDLGLIESYAALLSERVGSPLSLQSLAEDLSISHPTAKRWLLWLSQLFYVYLISPYSTKMARSIKKQSKLYLWDWSEVEDLGARFENMVAGHLLKACHYWTDSGLGNFEMFYLRDKEKREVDFCMTQNKKPWFFVEAKLSETQISPALLRLAAQLKPAIVVQVVSEPGIHEFFSIPGLSQKGVLISADQFLGLF